MPLLILNSSAASTIVRNVVGCVAAGGGAASAVTLFAFMRYIHRRVSTGSGEDDQSCRPGANRLNLSDGILGQGINPLVLLTTNQPLTSLHPAVVRPGRCLDVTEFGPMPAEAPSAWLGTTVATSHTLAELYALRAAQPTSTPQPADRPTGQYL